MNKKISLGLGLIFFGILVFMANFNLFYIISFATKWAVYASAVIMMAGGVYDIVEVIRSKKK